LNVIQRSGTPSSCRRIRLLGERECFLDAQTGAPQDDDHRSHAPAVTVIECVTMTATISSTVGGSAGYRIPLLRGGRPAL
jgi:hypothetical protein